MFFPLKTLHNCFKILYYMFQLCRLLKLFKFRCSLQVSFFHELSFLSRRIFYFLTKLIKTQNELCVKLKIQS